MRKSFLVLMAIASLGLAGLGDVNEAMAASPLTVRVNEAFRQVFGQNPVRSENIYWLGRVVRGEKRTYEDLVGAMYFYKARGFRVGGVNTKSSARSLTSSKQEMIVQTLSLFVNIFGNDPTNAEKVWWRKRISCGEIKNMSALENSMRYHKTKGARKGRDTICGQTGTSSSTSSSGVIKKSVAGMSDHPMGDVVRIGIFHTNGSAISLTANGTFQIREGATKVLGTAGKNDTVAVSWSGGLYHVRGAAGSFDVPNKIRLVPLGGAISQIKSYSDASTTIAGKNYNRFRGIIEIRKCTGCGELWAINELHVEYYLRGLAETSGDGPEEYIKALGIAARTYVLYHKVVTGGRSEARGYDIGRTADDQIYRGYEYEIITPRMSSIFGRVKGIIVTGSDADQPVSTVYFSDSDGRTRSAKEVWNTNRFPQLQQSVKDPYHVSISCKGHCVGMSAQGAYGFASKEGWSYQKILNYYYRAIKLVKAY